MPGYPLDMSPIHRCPAYARELARVVYDLLYEPPRPGAIAGGCVQTPSSPHWRDRHVDETRPRKRANGPLERLPLESGGFTETRVDSGQR